MTLVLSASTTELAEIADVVDRHQRLVGDVEDAAHGAGGRIPHGLVDPGDVGGVLHFGHDVHQGHVRGGDPHRHAVDAPVDFRDDHAGGPGGSGGGGDHRHRAGAGPPQVLVRLVEERLAVGVGVDGGDQAAMEAEAVVQHLDHRSQAVGGAARVGDDVVAVGVVGVVVDAEHQSDVDVLAWRAHDHLAGAGGQVAARALAVTEEAGRLDDHVHPQLPPWQAARVALGEHADQPAIDHQPLVRDLDRSRIRAVHRVVLEEMGQGARVHQVVHGDELDVGGVLPGEGAQHVAADAAESVDGESNRHGWRCLPGRV